MLKNSKLYKYSTILYLLISLCAIKVSYANSCQPTPLTKERIVKIQKIVADNLEASGNTLSSPVCFQATYTAGIILRVLGYEPIKDYQLLTSELHAFVYYPKNDLITDVVMAKWTPWINKNIDWEEQRGFTGTPQELSKLLVETSDLEKRWSFSSKDFKLLTLNQSILGEENSFSMNEIVQQLYNSFFEFYNYQDPTFEHINNHLKTILKKEFGCEEKDWLAAAKNHTTLKSHRLEMNLDQDLANLDNDIQNNSVNTSQGINLNSVNSTYPVKEDQEKDTQEKAKVIGN